MQLLTVIEVTPYEYPILTTSDPLYKNGMETESLFIPDQRIVLDDRLEGRQLLRKLSRELYRAWTYHWPGPISPVRRKTFKNWVCKTMKTHFPDIVENLAERHDDAFEEQVFDEAMNKLAMAI